MKKKVKMTGMVALILAVFVFPQICNGADYDITIGTPFQYEPETEYGHGPALCKIDDTHYLCAYRRQITPTNDRPIRAVILVVDTVTGTIDTTGTYLDFDTVYGRTGTLCKIDDTHYLCAYQGVDSDGWAVVLTVDTSTWEITKGTSFEFDAFYGWHAELSKIDDTHYLCAYEGENYWGSAVILTVDASTWEITKGTTFVFDTYGRYPALSKIDRTHHLCAYMGPDSDGWAVVLTVDTGTGIIDTAGTYLEFDADYGRTPALSKIDSTHHLCAYWGPDQDGWAVVLTVDTSTWEVTNETPFEYDIDAGRTPALSKIDDNHYLCPYWGGSALNAWAVVLTVDTSTWEVTKETPLMYDTKGAYPALSKIDNNGHYLCAYEGGTDYTAWSVIFNVELPSGIIGDFNSDGYVDATDLQMFGDHWHFVDTDPGWDALYDLIPDGIIDAADLQVFGDHWHEGTPPKSGSGGKNGKGPNADAGIVFDLDATTSGNQNLTSIPSQAAGTYIRLDVYCTGVQNLDTYEFEVIYDPTELAYVTAVPTNPITFENNILTSLGGEALGWMIDSSTPGVLSIAYTLAGTDPAQAPEGEGLIADIVFEALVATYGTLGFGDVYYYDSYGVVDLITDTGTATLPVELSTFTAFYSTELGFVSICWATTSETDVNGFNIYRNTEDAFGEADKINFDLIEGHGTTSEVNEYSFIDETADPYYTTYYYWLEVIDFGGTTNVHGSYKYIPIDINNNGELDIIASALNPCYPNPARIGNDIQFNFCVGGLEGTTRYVELKVYNVLGKLVAEIVNGERLVNNYTEAWRPENLSNGLYFYQLKTENYNEVKKMLLIR